MIIDIQKISEGGSTYVGEMPPESLDLEGDKFIRAKSPIRYELTAEIVSEQLIVRGFVETELDLLCAVCADFFSTTVRVSSFLRAYALESGMECLDLTDDIREDILLVVPHYPRGEADDTDHCRQCGRSLKKEDEPRSTETPPEVWDPLNRLKL